jgi:hypothetical protein
MRVHQAIVKCRPDFGKWPRPRALPNLKTCQKFSGETKAKGEGGIIMKNEMPSLLLDEIFCFITLPPYTL